MVITFLSDFGVADDFSGVCHGVIKRIAPEVDVIDITHGIDATSILQGAIVLANTLPYMPVGIHLAVVDPDVGTPRRALVVRTGDGRLLVGPDNGLLVPASESLGGAVAANEITNLAYALDPVSPTFHGRDVFSPAAAHLALGVDPGELGGAIQPDSLVQLEFPKPEIGTRRIRATCLYVDRFGNIQLNLTAGEVEGLGIVPGRRVEVELPVDRFYAVAARTFADARPGDIILYEDAYRNIALAISRGNAAETFHVRAGTEVRLRADSE
ncbi:MAG: SAM-dependent chlorinase/fluorinase [Actinomycetota bacterium]|nr:SAM-dependent chlorinase/fluorinase [Actinomycetota bacterium]